ncbi:AAA family ATPase [Bacillus thuringiensis]|uniref:AAA family ATPase n=2 Tax=Bacillus TaxID=1386 RepID=UPI0003100438|nr:ATP-binding protein [Bacillus thuringiensis]
MTNKITSMEVVSFRGIQNLKVENLGGINIVTGNNNSGKTSFLEAMMMLSVPESLLNIIRVARLRESGKLYMPMLRNRLLSFQVFSYLFNKKSEGLNLLINGNYGSSRITLSIEGEFQKLLLDEFMIKDLLSNSRYSKSRYKEIESLDEEVETFIGKHSYSVNDIIDEKKELFFNKYILDEILRNNRRIHNNFKYNFISSIDHIIKDFINVIIKNIDFKKEVIEILNIFDEDIEDLVIVEDDDRYIHCIVSKNNGLMPLSIYGDGIKKVIALASGIISSKNGILLVDEIETSIHKKIMPRVFHWLIESCRKFSVQLFLTTHSLEVVDEILNANPSAIEKDVLRLVTLKKNETRTIARVLTGEEAIKLRNNFDMELRG